MDRRSARLRSGGMLLWKSTQLEKDLLVRLPLIIGPTTLMVCDQQELLVVLVIDILPRLQCILVRGLGLKDERHGAVVAFAVYFGSETFEALHEDYGEPVWGVERHVCEE